MMRCRSGQGFTLFEVLISMLILSVAVLSVALLLPAGLRAQEAARFKAVAAVTAFNLVTQFEHAHPVFAKVRSEGLHMSHNVWSTHEPGMYDIERYLSSSYHARNALVPLPLDIARRLDSDNDEIQSILDEGGYIYFPSPLPSRLGEFEGSLRDAQVVINVADTAVPTAYEGLDEARRLVIGFSGYAQQNAIPWHPMSVGPGREYYPMAPLHRVYGPRIQGKDLGLSQDTDIEKMSEAERQVYLSDLSNCTAGGTYDRPRYMGNIDHAAWAYWRDNETDVGQPVFDLYEDVVLAFGDWGEGWGGEGGPVGAQWHQRRPMSDDDIAVLAPKVEAYFKACEDLVKAVVPGFERKTATEAAFSADLAERYPTVTSFPEPWQVLALRYYGHAAMWLSRFVPLAGWTPSDASGMTQAHCVAIHEYTLRWAIDYRAHRPYDWGAPRPFNSPSFLDMPLLQVDLFNSSDRWDPSDGTYLLNQGASRASHDPPGYRVIAPDGCTADVGGNTYAEGLNAIASAADDPNDVAQDIPTNVYGNWWSHDNNYDIYAKRMAEGWGDSTHFNLLHRFEAAERCRQLIVWAVDWQRYEDAESSPAAPTDASWYTYESDGTVRRGEIRKRGRSEIGHMGALSAMLNWKSDPIANLSAYTSEDSLLISGGGDSDTDNDVWVPILNRGTPSRWKGDKGNARMGDWMGMHGLDANGNNRFDRGTVPASVRMRATEVARFNLYDPRVWASLRN